MLISNTSQAAELIAMYGGASDRPAELMYHKPTEEQLARCKANCLLNVDIAFNLLRQYHHEKVESCEP